MNKEFIPYEQALALKELGFNEPCFGYYYSMDDKKVGLEMYIDVQHQDIYFVQALLYQQAFRWFREKYNLESHTKKDWSDGVCLGYESIIECVDGIIDCGTYKTYEEAQLECLKKLIEIVKQNNNE
jgi:hypothetical protein